jgi:hypothetical protein
MKVDGNLDISESLGGSGKWSGIENLMERLRISS